MAAWFKRTPNQLTGDEKRNIPDGVWIKCDSCGEVLFRKELTRFSDVCPQCRHHFRYPAEGYVELLLEPEERHYHDTNLFPGDPLEFKDSQKYSDRVVKSFQKTGLNDALRCVSGRMGAREVELAVMDFAYMGGSVGSVVGEMLRRAIDRAVKRRAPLMVVSCSGGMRMQEGVLSLMQMAKAAGNLTRLAEARIPYISILTNPTTGGTTASFSMLGDIILAEPKALIGFAGPRVIKQTIGQDLPEGFQSSEFLLEHGFLDMIVDRSKLKETVMKLLGLLGNS
ncbi:MAG: acetyl-CoA carboxylase, carboxyltransferase subunit beta [Calditrichota bacterium]